MRIVREGVKRKQRGFFFSFEKQAKQEMSRKMNEKIDVMKETIAKTTPRSFSLLFLLASVPAFYFINEMMENDYNHPEFVNNSNRFYKYYYLYNLTFYACSLALTKFNFHSPSSKYTLPKTPTGSAFLPLVLSMVGLMLPESDSKHMVWPAMLTQMSTLFVEGTMANKGMIPFWFYSHRHYIGLFLIIMFVINYAVMNRLAKRRKSHSH